MELMFYNCSSLSSLPDISKWNTNKVVYLSGIFTKCTSLISIPDISRWKIQDIKDINNFFSDCYLLLYLPDISRWNNYNKDQLNTILDYKKLNDFLNFIPDVILFPSSPDSFDSEEYEKEIIKKFFI